MIRLSGLLLLAAFAWSQPPSSADSTALIERSRQKALEYAQSLPDFMCSEIIQRYARGAEGIGWIHTDTLTVKLRYSQKTEAHKLQLINNKPTDKKFEELGGATSSGEFGGILRTIFDPASQAAFGWDSWKTLRKHRIAVYQYAVSAANSPYFLKHNNREGIVGLHGTVEVDGETGEVLRLIYIAYDIPKHIEVQFFATTVEYDFASVAGRNYLLPARSEAEIHGSETWARNKMEFRNYRKFSTDSVIDFGAGK